MSSHNNNNVKQNATPPKRDENQVDPLVTHRDENAVKAQTELSFSIWKVSDLIIHDSVPNFIILFTMTPYKSIKIENKSWLCDTYRASTVNNKRCFQVSVPQS